jgi:serine/threonine protein kinase
MSSSAQQFLGELSRYGLLSRTNPDDALRSLDLDERSDEHLVVSRLVDTGHLTEFQAREIRAGQIPNLLVDQYVILDRLGEGGMGVVFKARHKLMDRLVAIKLLTPRLSSRPDLARRFHREIQTQSKLAHPTIVTAFDAGEVRGSLYLVMEYVDGENLAELVRSRGPFSPVEALGIARQAALGLAFAHRLGVIHRDVKPQNLLLDRSGRLKILDFGLARLNLPDDDSDSGDNASELTMAGQIMGTVDYMAPEQVDDSRGVDGRSDIYSLGCTLHFLLSGRIVFPGKSTIEKVIAHRESPVPSLTGFLTDFPPATAELLDRVFGKMVAKNRSDRYETADELAKALREVQTALAQSSAAPRPQVPPPQIQKSAGGGDQVGPVKRDSDVRTPPAEPSTTTKRSPGSPSGTSVKSDRPHRESPTGSGGRDSAAKPAESKVATGTSGRQTRPNDSRRVTPVSASRSSAGDKRNDRHDDTILDDQSGLGLENLDEESSAEAAAERSFWTKPRLIAVTAALLGVGSFFAWRMQSKPPADAPLVIESSGSLVPEVDVPEGSGEENPNPVRGNLKRKFKL